MGIQLVFGEAHDVIFKLAMSIPVMAVLMYYVRDYFNEITVDGNGNIVTNKYLYLVKRKYSLEDVQKVEYYYDLKLPVLAIYFSDGNDISFGANDTNFIALVKRFKPEINVPRVNCFFRYFVWTEKSGMILLMATVAIMMIVGVVMKRIGYIN